MKFMDLPYKGLSMQLHVSFLRGQATFMHAGYIHVGIAHNVEELVL